MISEPLQIRAEKEKKNITENEEYASGSWYLVVVFCDV